MKYEIEGSSLPVVICYPEEGEAVCTEGGLMSWMSPNMKMETTSGGGLKKTFGRLFAGESIFLNEFTPVNGPGMVAFSSNFPGEIIPCEVTPGNGIVVQKKGFLAMEKGLELSIFFQERFGTGIFGGEGFVMERITGNGIVFIEIDGHCKEYVLGEGESLVVDTGHLAAMSETCSMRVEKVKGVKNMVLGGEGVFNTVVTGPGKVFLQSMPIMNLADTIKEYLPENPLTEKLPKGFNLNIGG